MRRILTTGILAAAAVIFLGGPAATRAYDFIGAKWPDSALPVPYCVNPAGAPLLPEGRPLLTDDAFVALVRSRFDMWQALPDSYVSFRFTGVCASSPAASGDGVNTVGWGRLAGSAAGVALPGASQETPYRSGLGGDLVEVDIIVDDRLLTGFDQSTALNHLLPVIVLHEIGHFIGLGHSERGGAVMAPSSLQLELSEDDVAGVRALYPGPQRATNLSVGDAACTGAAIAATFSWTPSAEADGYWLDFSLDPAFSSFAGVYVGPGGTGATRLTNLAPRTEYYWRLWNFNWAGGGHSAGGPFVTPNCIAGSVVPAGPADLRVETACTAGTVVAAFNWTQALAADGYFVDLSLDPGFGGFLNAQVPGTGLFWAGLLPNETHFFRVFAYNAAGGSHSYVASFMTPSC
jgi:hypothetical protein